MMHSLATPGTEIGTQFLKADQLGGFQINLCKIFELRLIKTYNNFEVCILFEGEFTKTNTAKCIEKITTDCCDKFTYHELEEIRKQQLQNDKYSIFDVENM